MIIQGVALNGTRMVDASIITNGLILWLDANNTASYPGTGTLVTDLSGNGNNHNLSSSGIYSLFDAIKSFNCSTTGIVTCATTLVVPNNFTYISWARPIASTAGYRTLLRSSNGGHPIIINQGTNLLGMWENAPGMTGFNSSGYDMSALANTWAQWVTTGDTSGQTFYVNGQQAGSPVTKTDSGKLHFGWGNIAGGVDQPWGYVTNLFLYNRKLTLEEIQQNYYALQQQFATPASVTSNLVLWYDPSDTISYPGTGTTITNLANTSLPGTMSNITYADPYFAYNGTSSQVSVPDNALLEPGSGDWTMEAWVYLSNISGSKVIMGKFDPGGLAADVSYSMRISGSTAFAQFGDGTGAFVNSTNYTLSLNTWTQLVYVWTNSGGTKTLQTFVNGASIGTVNHSLNSLLDTPSNLYIGSYNNGEYAQWMNGRIGVTRLYNAALTSAQVLQNFNADRSKYGI